LQSVDILEIGFGTGLNALLTAQESSRMKIPVTYCSLEAFPVNEEIWSQLNYAEEPEARELFKKLHQAAWSTPQTVLPNFQLLKLPVTLQEADLADKKFNLVFFDAFAPSKQPEMWHYDVLKKVVSAISVNGLFVTYCAKGQLKRDLKALGLEVETLAGPPGKKEMVRARRI
jgi:tRNA U34 5-methylaminomethyl-2-thiouridine-forming methyltransferase MnmC